MTAPNIDMIANSLLNCSLNYQNNPMTPSPSSSTSSSSSSPAFVPPPQPSLTGSSEGSITLELNSNIALPFQWEQCLDIRTGQVYYINWEDGSRTATDPRSATLSLSSSDQDSESDSDQQIQFSYDNNIASNSSSDDSNSSSSINLSSAVSSFSPTESSSSSIGTGSGTTYGADTSTVLVAAGCKSCFMYFMIPKFVDVCPKCGGDGLLHLDRA